MRWLKEKLKDNRGSELVEFIISLALKLGVLLICIFSLCYMYSGIKLYVACDKVVRSVSVSGLVDTTTYSLVDTLVGDSLTVNTDISGTFFDAAHTRIQLRDTFTITLTSSFEIPIITPLSGGDPITLSFPLKAQVTGMSEKYWRDGE